MYFSGFCFLLESSCIEFRQEEGQCINTFWLMVCRSWPSPKRARSDWPKSKDYDQSMSKFLPLIVKWPKAEKWREGQTLLQMASASKQHFHLQMLCSSRCVAEMCSKLHGAFMLPLPLRSWIREKGMYGTMAWHCHTIGHTVPQGISSLPCSPDLST